MDSENVIGIGNAALRPCKVGPKKGWSMEMRAPRRRYKKVAMEGPLRQMTYDIIMARLSIS
jgi:hypothetical protein